MPPNSSSKQATTSSSPKTTPQAPESSSLASPSNDTHRTLTLLIAVTTGLASSANGRDAILSVTDNGPGIDPTFRTKIFDRFTRADKARSGSDGTTGLGLPIVKAIVEAHNGTIDVVSTPGRTEFVVRLPLDTPTEA